MKTINRTQRGIALLASLAAAFGSHSAEVAEHGGLDMYRHNRPLRYGYKPSGCAAAKRKARKLQNIRSRSKK